MYLTLKQCSELTDINISTCRYYKDVYLQYFRTQGEGKTTKFEKSSTVEILNVIKASYVRKLDHDQIVELLDKMYGVNVTTDIVTQEPDNNTIATQQEDLVQSIRHVLLEELIKQSHIIIQLQDELEDMRKEFNEGFARLREKDEKDEDGRRRVELRDNEVLQHLSDIKKEQQQRNKPLWKRIFSRT